MSLADILEVANSVGAPLSYLFILGGVTLYLMRFLRGWFERWMAVLEDHTQKLDAIAAQTTATNGRVNNHDDKLSALHDQVVALEATMATVLELQKGKP